MKPSSDTRFCDVCGRELKTPARIESRIENIVGGYRGEMGKGNNCHISITLDKIAGAYADFCHNCAEQIITNATILYGEIGGTLKITEEGIK